MYLFFDTETTGLPRNHNAPVSDLANWPRVVQIGWLIADSNGREVSSQEYIIKPTGFSIPSEAARVHGITTEVAQSTGVELKSALVKFCDATRGVTVLVAHNLSFDEKVVGAELIRTNVSSPFGLTTRICTMRSSTNFCRIPSLRGYKWPTLSELYHILFQRDLDTSHKALADVRACAQCFFELRCRGIIST